MKQSELKLLAKFAFVKETKNEVIVASDCFDKTFRPDKNIADAECLLDKLEQLVEEKKLSSFHLDYLHSGKYTFHIYNTSLILVWSENKSKYLAICNAVLKLIKESKNV